MMNNTVKYLFGLLSAAVGGGKLPSANGVDYDALYEIADRHSVACTVAELIQADKSCPSEVKKKFANKLMMTVQTEANQQYEAEKLISSCEAKGIDIMPLKGFILKNYYPKTYMRSSCDVDFLTPQENIEAVDELIKSQGFELHYDDGGVGNYIKKPYVVFELHYKLIADASAIARHMEKSGGVFDGAERAIRDGNSHVLRLSDEDFYLYMILHFAKHFCEGGCGIRHVLDMYVFDNYFGDRLNRSYIEKELKSFGLFDFEKKASELSQIWFKNAETNEFFESLTDFILKSGTFGTLQNSYAAKLAESGGDNAEKSLLIRLLFPSYEHLCLNYKGLRGKKWLTPIYWIIRPIDVLLNRRDGISKLKISQNISKERVSQIKNIYTEMGVIDNSKKS